jgi:hypothetical protein
MIINARDLCIAPKRYWRLALLAVAAPLLLLGSAASAANPPALRLLYTIAINGTAAKPNTQMFSFDISWVDPANGLYFLGDRSNAAIDVIDTTGAFTGTPDTLFGQIGGAAFGFAGDTGSTATSGPNGVTSSFPCIFATDGPSRVVSINANVSYTTPASSLNTGGTKRADELAYDPTDGLLLVINNADTPPFGTLITVNKSTCALGSTKKIIFDAAHGANATNGAEQPVWEPKTGKFYVSIPEFDGDGSGAFFKGGIAQINTSGVLEGLYQINYCQPAGLTVGPNGDLLVGCNSVFDNNANQVDTAHKCTAVIPSPSPTGAPAGAPVTCKGIAEPQTVICNPGPGRGCTGNALVSVPGVGGGDEIWFNSGDGNYYITAGNDPVGPVFGVVTSGTSTPANTLTQLVPTLPPVPAVAGVHGAGTVHSIAASAANNHVYVPLPANTLYNNCTKGCVAVFSAQ